MKKTTIVTELEKEDIRKDLDTAIYMFHFLEERFSKEEIGDVCFTLRCIGEGLECRGETSC